MEQFQLLLKKAALVLIVVMVISLGWKPIARVQADTSLIAVLPGQAANDVDTPIVITGSGFSNDGGIPQVFLGDVPLTQVEWVNETTINTVVPWGLKPGIYNLRVVNPNGDETNLDSAFEVIQGVGQWNSKPIDGGPVRTVIPIADIPGKLYAYSVLTSAIYRSIDYGANWVTVSHAAGQFFKTSPSDADTLYLDAQQSTDGGETWRAMLDGGFWPGTDRWAGYNTQTFPHPTNSDMLFLAAAEIPEGSGDPSGLLRSVDHGFTWTTVETGLLPNDSHITAMEFSGTTIYLGTRDGNLYQSDDEGITWQQIGSTNVLDSIGILKVNPYETDELWITTHFSVTASAKMIKMDLGDPLHPVSTVDAWSQESYPMSLGFLNEDTLFIGAQWDNGWISENDGNSWDLFQPSTGKPGYWLAVDPWDNTQNTFYIADEQYGIQKTSDYGLTWIPSNVGLHAMSPDNLGVDPANPAQIYAKIAENGWPGIFVSNDGGQNWTFSSLEPASGGTRPMTSMLAVNTSRVFAGAHGNDVIGYGPQLFISEDQGGSWTRLNVDPTPAFADSFYMPWILKTDPQHPNTLLMTAVIGNRTITPDEYVSEIYRSTDNGDTWQRVNLADQIGRQVFNLTQLGFDPNNSDIVYAAGDHDILKSTDNGLSWSVLVEDSGSWLSGPIAVEPISPYRVYVGNQVSLDGGQSWEPANMPINPNQMSFVSDSDTLYISGDGLAFSYDGGTTWQTPQGPLASARINALAVANIDQRIMIYVGTPGGETPQLDNSTGNLHTKDSLSGLEAGVYRLTEVRRNIFLPMVIR